MGKQAKQKGSGRDSKPAEQGKGWGVELGEKGDAKTEGSGEAAVLVTHLGVSAVRGEI